MDAISLARDTQGKDESSHDENFKTIFDNGRVRHSGISICLCAKE
jgi:hypothetical protein